MEEPDSRVLRAQDVYVLMKKDYRISRNIRASWFFQHLNTVFKHSLSEDVVDTNDELQVISVIPDDDTQCDPGQEYSFILLPSSIVTFIARRYRYVFILDLSPSVASVDTSSQEILYDKIHEMLSHFLQGLVLPFCLPGSSAVFSPDIYITVIAYTPIKTCTFHQVLCQGLVVSCDNVVKFLASMKEKLKDFESKLAQSLYSFIVNAQTEDYVQTPPGESANLSKHSDIINSPEAGIVNMLRLGMLALQLLPENSSAGIIVITDGCIGVPDVNQFETLLTQLRTSTTACTFLRVGSGTSPFRQFGHIPNTEFMQFMATATFGSYFCCCPAVDSDAVNKLNVYHRAMFLWNFQKGLEGFRFDLTHHNLGCKSSCRSLDSNRLLVHPVHGKVVSVMQNIRKLYTKNKLNTSLFSILSVRLREGYTIKDIALTKGDTQIEVRLLLPWREYAQFEYVAMAPWPLEKSRNFAHVEITIEGSYDFVNDITSPQQNSNRILGPFRTMNVMKFWMARQGLSQTDELLVHLQSFASNPAYYNLPESIKKGVPLFYLPQSTAIPALSTQLSSKDSAMSQFASFWRPVVNLDIKVWQKWMHTHRIGFVLEHDTPVHKNLHIPNSSGRFSMVQCRQANTSLTHFLKEWSTFVLLDNQSYIKLIQDDPEKPPTSFFLLRITSKPPCLVLRIAFLGGTPGFQRYEIVKELKQKVSSLKFPQRGTKSDKSRRTLLVKKADSEGPVRRAPLLREWSDIFCCVLLVKPVENILIRYETKPKDMTKLDENCKEIILSQSQSQKKTGASLFNSLSRYLLHQRWIWTVQQPSIGRILSTLAKMRIQQGFHFGVTNSGIVNMVLEVDMHDPDVPVQPGVKTKQKPTCVLQYVLFPPHNKATSDSMSDDEADELEMPEADGELQIVTECWIEPQMGVSINNTRERSQFDGLTCHQMAQTFFPLDLSCVSCLVTFEHLMFLCQNSVIPSDLTTLLNKSGPGLEVDQVAPTIQHIGFPFDLISLLSRSQQAEVVFPSYIYEPVLLDTDSQRDSKEGNGVLLTLLCEHLQQSSHRNVCLSGEQSRRFLEQLQDRVRDRDANPFPFLVSDLLSQCSDKTKVDLSGSSGAPTSQENVQGGKEPGLHRNSGSESERVYPEWMCFMKAISATSLMVTVLPATFNDVILVNKTSAVKIPQQTEKEKCETEQATADNVSKAYSSEADANRFAEVTSDGHTTDGGETVTSDKTLASEISEVLEDEENANTRLELAEDTAAEGPQGIETGLGDTEQSENTQTSTVEGEDSMEQVSEALIIPVYVYDCVLHNVLDSLINPWDFQLPADKYEDMTFEPQTGTSENGTISSLMSPRVKRVSFSLESLKSEDKDDEGLRFSYVRSQERRLTEGSSDGSESLAQNCSLLSETYFNCFVKGVFQSLQKGFKIQAQDIDNAINICEELFPLETNVTWLLHASCGHFQQLVNEAKKGQPAELSDDHHDDQTGSDNRQKRPSVRFMDIMDESESDSEGQSRLIPANLQIPHTSIHLDLPSLHLDQACEPASGLHQLIKIKFVDVVQKWFSPVPANQDYYFYCPERPMTEEGSDERETTVSDGITIGLNTSNENENTGNEESADPECDTGFSLSREIQGEKISTTSQLDSEESLDDNGLDLEMTLDDTSDQMPLFIYFTCTIKSRLEHHSVPLRSMATCLGELSSVLDNLSEVDLSDLKITFDLNCLTLPSDADVVTPKKPSFMRMMSNASATDMSPPPSEYDDRSSAYLSVQNIGGVIGHLPNLQREAVTKCMEEIEWLLHDEIVSDLRLMQPIRPDALLYVTEHVQVSSQLGKANVNSDSVPLQFVFGPDQSLSRFTQMTNNKEYISFTQLVLRILRPQYRSPDLSRPGKNFYESVLTYCTREFQKMNLPNYLLVQEADWFYLAKKRVIPTSFVNAIALSSALTQLSKDGSKCQMLVLSPKDKMCSPGSRSEVSELLDDSKHSRTLSPLVLSQGKEKPFFDAMNEGVSGVVKAIDLDGSVEKASQKGSQDASGDKQSSENVDSPKLLEDGVSPNRLDRRKSKELGEKDAVKFEECRHDQESKNLSGGPSKDKNIEAESLFRFPSGGAQKSGEESSPSSSSALGRRRSSDLSDPRPLLREGMLSLALLDSALPSKSDVVKSDVSIQLTKTDGRSEPFRSSPGKTADNSTATSTSFEEDDEENGAGLKRCSSFAGFKSERPCETAMKPEESPLESPVKGAPVGLTRPVGRFRHFSAPSGQGTPHSKPSTLPQTPSWISSRGSFTEDAYDGDMSEVDDSATSFSESSMVQRPMPNFWLVMQIIHQANRCSVDVFYQRREAWRDSSESLKEQRNLLSQVKKYIESTCRKVNQLLLLNELYDTRMCNSLLVPEADEEVSWKIDTKRKPRLGHSTTHSSSSEGEDDDDLFEKKYLAAAMDFGPGFFDCECVWKTQFVLHPRLKAGAGAAKMSRGMQAIKAFLNPFSSVNNRKNMYVIRETAGQGGASSQGGAGQGGGASSQGGVVFYLKLKEVCGLQRQTSGTGGEEGFLTESLTSIPGAVKKETDADGKEKDADSVSITSTSSGLSLSTSQQKYQQDRVELYVHGIQEAGIEIKEELVRAIQNRLDETTLDIITVTLRRNPVCKLMPEDVTFIQPAGSDPTDRLYLTVPSRASLQVAAVVYYLRQNLLQFLHTPNYVDSRSETHFMDVFDGTLKPIPADQGFLYIQPQTTGKIGVAFVSVSLVDGQGNQVRLLQCARPCSNSHDQIETQIEMEMFVSTQIYEHKHQGKRPGPTSLIQFHIWERGSTDLKILRDKLFAAMKHTLCGVVMEYYILTAPICEVPKHLQELLPLPTFSAPSSPLCVKGEDFRERKHSMVVRKTSDSLKSALERRQSLQSHSTFQSWKDSILATKRLKSPPPDSGSKSFDIPDRSSPLTVKAASPDPQTILGSPRFDTLQMLAKYESGDLGLLHRIYTCVLEDWLQYCFSHGDPGVSRQDLTLESRFSVDFILHEFQSIVSNISSGTTTQVYKITHPEEADNTPEGVHYHPMRAPFNAGRRKSETSLDTCHSASFTAGEDLEFLAVGRNMTHWYTCVQHEGQEEIDTALPKPGKQTSQKFQAYIPTPEKPAGGIFSDPPSFIPRQRFVFLSLKNKKLSVYTYNWTNDLAGSLSKYMNRLVHWNNARVYLLLSIVTQKMGLYNHYLFNDPSSKQESNPYKTTADMDTLIRHPAPPQISRDVAKRTSSHSNTRTEAVLSFDVTFKDLQPIKPLHKSYLACQRDPVIQNGLQAMDIRRDFTREYDKLGNIRNLYLMWIHKTVQNYPISEDTIKTLKQSSRLFHYCTTPLLIWRPWRERVLEKYKVTRQDSVSSVVSASNTDSKTRSRHSSGTSTGSARAKRTNSEDGKKKQGIGAESKVSESMESLTQESAQEEEWHIKLRSDFMGQYIDYLQSIGFQFVQIRQATPARKRTSRQDSDEPASQDENQLKLSDTHNLQKTLSGGVLLIELSFRQEYFCVKLYTCDHNKLGITVNQQFQREDLECMGRARHLPEMKLMFVDECEKCKDLIHVHSFAHDFHLRCIQAYIGGDHSIFKPHYHLTSLISDFIKVYPYAPSFSRNFLQHDIVTIPKPSCSSQQLYEYMLTHAKLHNMMVLKMLHPGDTDSDFYFVKAEEHALISHEVRDLSTDQNPDGSQKKESYNIGLVIIQEPGFSRNEKMALQLQYFIILTSSREKFPRHSLEKNLGALMSKARQSSTGEEVSWSEKDEEKESVTVRKYISTRQESTDYLGFSNIHQPPMYQVLQAESHSVREKIKNMAVVSMEKCRRDSLWNRLLIYNMGEEDSKRKKRSDTEDVKDLPGRLTYEEFQELLERVYKVPLHEIDPRLVPFLHMSLPWYQGLAQVLSHKYPDVRRCFTSQDGGHIYHVVLNPKFLDVFMLMHIDNTTCNASLFAVYRKPVKEQESSSPPGETQSDHSVQDHMENFINVCCFHLWSSML